MKRILLIASIAIWLLLLYAAFGPNPQKEYVRHQQAYSEALSELGAEADYPIKLRQIVIPEMGVIDRCVSCHVGVEDPRMAGAAQPLTTHPGDFLSDHDIQKVGCTVCHDGQGRATRKKDAHANRFPHWEKKRLLEEFAQAACVRCHDEDSASVLPLFVQGREVFRQNGCTGCHKLRGVGGHLGPDLTELGDASTHVKAPTADSRDDLLERFNGDVNLAYIYESITEPDAQPIDSGMLDYDLTEDEALAMTVYIKSFAVSAVPEDLRDLRDTPRAPSGGELFAANCSACHGADGMGTNVPQLEQIGPAIANENFLAIADRQFVDHKVRYSDNPDMPAWGMAGGFREQDIAAVAEYLFSLKGTAPTLAEIDAIEGVAKYGRSIFANQCSGCHGIDGAYEMDLIGPTLQSPEFLSYADREFLHSTIGDGRAETAMPSWFFLAPQDYADLLAYFEAKQELRSTFDDAKEHMADDEASDWGRARYSVLCGTCHGPDRRGQVGPSLDSPELMLLASDEFIYETVVGGRAGTAMGHWRHLSSEDVGWLMAYIRTARAGDAERLFAQGDEILGSESQGSLTFSRICAQCHGAEGVGHIAPAIGNSDFLAVADDDFIKETAAAGRSGTGMMGNLRGQGGTASLSEREINQVVAYLRSRENSPRPHADVARVQGDIDLGRDRFSRICAQCHGPAGSGGKGPGIGRPGLAAQVSDGFMVGTMANGRTGTEMKGFAPGGDGLVELDEHDIRSITAYLRSGVDVDKLTRMVIDGTPANGQLLYEGQCSQCHGDWEARSFAPHLTNEVFLEAASDAYLQATMSLGRHRSAMQSMMRGGGGVVSMTSKEVNDIISYLRQSAKLHTGNGRK